MRKTLFILAWLASSLCWAGSEVVLVSGVRGAVTFEAIGIKKTALQPFVRLKAGDRLSIPADAQVSLVYFDKGRQETWPGTATLIIGEQESEKVSGSGEVRFKQLPPQVTKQMQRFTPDLDGKVGAVRYRTYEPVEENYKKIRKEAAAGDIDPEIYLLAGLFGQKRYDQLEKEMERISTAFPADESLKVLRKLYKRAIADARRANGTPVAE